jgi:hypothetical protein
VFGKISFSCIKIFIGAVMKPVIFENTRTRERVVCDDVRNIAVIEGEEYLTVHRVNEQRAFLIRRAAVVPVKNT